MKHPSPISASRRPAQSFWRICALVTLGASSGLLQAEVIKYTVTTPAYPTPAAGLSLTSLSIPQFDPAAGLLTDMAFSLTALSFVTVSGNNPTSSGVAVSYSSEPTVIMPDLSPYGPLVVYQPAGSSFIAQPGAFADSSQLRSGTSNLSVTNQQLPGLLQIYLGMGSVDRTIFLSNAGPDGTGLGPRVLPFSDVGPISGPFTSWAAQLEIEYRYTIPEPASISTFSLGSLVLAGLLWRRKTRLRRESIP